MSLTRPARIRRPAVGALALASAAALLIAGVPAGGMAAPVASAPVPSAAVPTSAARAAVPSAATATFQLTIAARYCPAYSDIMANRARNNIQESLRNLGKDTVYAAGDPVRPGIEGPNNPACQPLEGFQFTLGRGYKGKTPQSEYLSLVTSPFAGTPTTLASVPELDGAGNPTGRDLAGAVTITLTAEQAQLAQQSSKLWIQGGTPTDPQGTALFGGRYGFGALRCSIDNLNGDNVEWIGYKSGTQHAFCYYYTVTPPPQAGIVVVKKQITAGSSSPARFDFQGNISYNPGGVFSLTAPGSGSSISFVRAVGTLWNFTEQVPAGWRLESLTCEKGNPASAFTITGARVDVSVAEGDTVTCTYLNDQPPPPPGRLELYKVTTGSIGSFPVRITRPDGTTRSVEARTTEPGQPALVAATGSGDDPQLGRYTVTETLPARTDAGYWRAVEAECNGDPQDLTREDGPNGTTLVSFSGRTVSGVGESCTITNDWQPLGRIRIEKTAQNGTGRFGFSAVQQLGDGATGRSSALTAVVRQPGDTVTASVDEGSDPLVRLPVGGPGSLWHLQELAPAAGALESWTLDDVVCRDDDTGDRIDTTAIEAGVELRLTTRSPQVTCGFTNRRDLRGTIGVVKTIEGDGARVGPAVVELRCDGRETLLLEATAPGATAGPVLTVRQPRDCQAVETSTGAAEGLDVTTTWSVDVDGSEIAEGSGTTVPATARPGQVVTVRILDRYAPAPGPTPQVPDPPVELPPTIQPNRPTDIIDGDVTTNAGQTATVSVRCRPRSPRVTRLLPAGDGPLCRVREGRGGRVTVIARPGVVVTVRLSAPAVGDFGPYEQTAVYIVRRR